ncbi:WYL domain-containing protein [Paenibacillaceae bacterium GAS479]|nr:WYL domain-containing protein [Paenibacillaceae bacterium GAS479]
MSLFDKVHNHELSRRLADSGALAVTSGERSWLRLMLEHPTAPSFLGATAIDKLQLMLQEDEPLSLAHLKEKARSRERRLYAPHLLELAELVRCRSGMRITCEGKGGIVRHHALGYPYRLEYAMSTKEWYLLWLQTSGRPLMRTRLTRMHGVEPMPLPPEEADRLDRRIGALRARRRANAVIELLPRYNRELSRILYALSCFQQEVHYDAESGMYRITVTYQKDESGYLLQKLRFLGKRVRVLEGISLQNELRASALKALARYGVSE